MFFFKNVYFSRPSLDILVILCGFKLDFFVEVLEISFSKYIILPEHLSDKFLYEKRWVDEHAFIQLLSKNFSLEILQVVSDDSVVQVSLWSEFFEIIACNWASMALLSLFQSEFALDISQILISTDVHPLYFSFALGEYFLLLFSVSLKQFIFSACWYEIKFEIEYFFLGLLIDMNWGNLAEKGRFFYGYLGVCLIFEDEFSDINESILLLVIHQL